MIGYRFPETKGRTLEEIGALFGDERIANRWYGVSREEKIGSADQAGIVDGKMKMEERDERTEDIGARIV